MAPIDSILCGDSAFILRQLPEKSIDLVITSPPYFKQQEYNAAGMGIGNERSIENYIDSLLEVFDESIRVLKSTGSIVYNIGEKYLDSSLLLVPFRFAIKASERNEVRLVNNITWVKSNPTPRQFDRRLVSSTEPFFHFVKGSDYYYDRNSFMSGNRKTVRHKPTSRLGEKYRELIDASELTREEKINAHNALNKVIYEVKSGDIQGFRIKIRGVHAEAFGGQEGGRKTQIKNKGFTVIRLHGQEMKKDVISCPVESIPGIKHCAIFPQQIIQEMIRLLCPMGGVVLDPYIGSGTTAIASIFEGRHYLGIDIDPLYCEISNQRIAECQINPSYKQY